MRLRGSIVLSALALGGCVGPVYANGVPTSSYVNAQAVANPTEWPASASPSAITDTKTETDISQLLSRMTVEQKVGQLVQADISAIKPEDLARYPLGSILAGGNSGPYGDERASAAQWGQLVTAFREALRSAAFVGCPPREARSPISPPPMPRRTSRFICLPT